MFDEDAKTSFDEKIFDAMKEAGRLADKNIEDFEIYVHGSFVYDTATIVEVRATITAVRDRIPF